MNKLTIDGYPTEEYLSFIRGYIPSEDLDTLTFIEEIIKPGWWMNTWGFKFRKKYRGKRKLELHTGGWSGNEDIINAIKDNIYLTNYKMKYVMWRTGGHYYFEVYV